MKKLSSYTISLGLILLSGCAQTDIDLLKKSVSELNKQSLDMKKEISEMKLSIEDLEKKHVTNSENIRINSEAISRMNTEITSLSTASIKNKPSKDEAAKIINESEGKSKPILIIDNSTDKTSLYNYAYELYKIGNFKESLKTFNDFIVLYPKDDLADNSMYWMSDIYFTEKDYKKSIDTLKMMIQKYPEGNKVPDGMFKIALAYDKLGERNEAITYIKKLIQLYHNTTASNLGKGKLNEWGVKSE